MKISPDHFKQLCALVRVGVERIPPRKAYIDRDPSVRNAATIKDPARRYRWDALYAAGASQWTAEVYQYADDSHVDTALKAALVHIAKPENC